MARCSGILWRLAFSLRSGRPRPFTGSWCSPESAPNTATAPSRPAGSSHSTSPPAIRFGPCACVPASGATVSGRRPRSMGPVADTSASATPTTACWRSRSRPASRCGSRASTPIVLQMGGREVIAVGSNAGVFKVLDAASGSVVWSRDLVNGSAVHGLLASPAYDGANFYVPSAGMPVGVFALAAADGKTLWTYDSGLPIYSAPAVGQGVLMLGIGDVFGNLNIGGVVALSSRDGSVLWLTDFHSAVFSGPAISGDTVLVGNSRGDLIAYRPA